MQYLGIPALDSVSSMLCRWLPTYNINKCRIKMHEKNPKITRRFLQIFPFYSLFLYVGFLSYTLLSSILDFWNGKTTIKYKVGKSAKKLSIFLCFIVCFHTTNEKTYGYFKDPPIATVKYYECAFLQTYGYIAPRASDSAINITSLCKLPILLNNIFLALWVFVCNVAWKLILVKMKTLDPEVHPNSQPWNPNQNKFCIIKMQ